MSSEMQTEDGKSGGSVMSMHLASSRNVAGSMSACARSNLKPRPPGNVVRSPCSRAPPHGTYERVRAGGKTVEVGKVRIAETGREALRPGGRVEGSPPSTPRYYRDRPPCIRRAPLQIGVPAINGQKKKFLENRVPKGGSIYQSAFQKILSSRGSPGQRVEVNAAAAPISPADI